MKLDRLIMISLGILSLIFADFIRDKLQLHFQYEIVIYPIFVGVLSYLTLFIIEKINPSILNKKINGIISTCVLGFIIIIVSFILK
ncbi:hypothetical protein HPK19_04185 [Arthrobacter citreus]|nr:hypothetical protein HPK19_04185 [Arthrobacter citreus]